MVDDSFGEPGVVNYYDQKWRAGGRCRTVCRPVRQKRRCFTASKLRSIIRYALKCGESREALCEVVREELACGCDAVHVFDLQLQGYVMDAREILGTIEQAIQVIDAIDDVVDAIPWFIRRFPGIRRLFLLIDALDEVAGRIKPIIDDQQRDLRDLERAFERLSEQICGD